MGKSCKPRKMLQSKLFVAKAASIQSRTDLPKFGVDLASIQRIRRLFPSLPTSPPVKPPAHLYPLFYLGSTTAFGVLLLSACSSLWNIKLMICRFGVPSGAARTQQASVSTFCLSNPSASKTSSPPILITCSGCGSSYYCAVAV